ncbi:S-layer homology domain-containing protein [Bacillus cereus]|nr:MULTISPECIES: S-layer homology domain-containing protein [Bacillus cereus group]MDA1868127.1 S-layer homology domain-containing protein [Bacillus cereus]
MKTIITLSSFSNKVLFFPRYLRAVKLPSQNSAETKKLGGRLTAPKKPDWFK